MLSFNSRVIINENPVQQTLKYVFTIRGLATVLAVFLKVGSSCQVSGDCRDFKAQRDVTVTSSAG